MNINLKMRYPESRQEDITDAFTRGYTEAVTASNNTIKKLEAENTKLRELAMDVVLVASYSGSKLEGENAKLKDELEKAEKRVSGLEDELARRDAVIEALKSKNERLKSMVQLFGTY